MKKIAAVIAGALFGATGAALPASAQDQEMKQVQCISDPGQRKSCSAGGEVVNAGITGISGEIPCILGYTWGFEENGIWVGGGCSANFAVTVIVPPKTPKKADPEVLRERLKKARAKIRELRSEVVQEREERQRIEGELSTAQAELAATDEKKEKRSSRAKRAPDWATRSVRSCSRKAVRESEKSGATDATVIEIVSARRLRGSWLVIGRSASEINGKRENGYFRCWVDEGKVQSFDNTI